MKRTTLLIYYTKHLAKIAYKTMKFLMRFSKLIAVGLRGRFHKTAKQELGLKFFLK